MSFRVAENSARASRTSRRGGATGRIQSRVDLDGFFIVSDYVEERGGQTGYRGHGVFGYDPQAKRYTMHWFDSMGSGTPSPARGTWEGNRLIFEQSNPMGHSRYTYVFEGENRYAFTIENSRDGKQWATFMEAKYTRR